MRAYSISLLNELKICSYAYDFTPSLEPAFSPQKLYWLKQAKIVYDFAIGVKST